MINAYSVAEKTTLQAIIKKKLSKNVGFGDTLEDVESARCLTDI